MSKETLDVVQESWRQSRRNGVLLGVRFRLNLQRINPTLTPIESKTTTYLLDFLLLEAADEVINCLDNKQELVCAMRNLCDLFELSNDKRKEIEHISKAIVVTIEQVMADYFTCTTACGRKSNERKTG